MTTEELKDLKEKATSISDTFGELLAQNERIRTKGLQRKINDLLNSFEGIESKVSDANEKIGDAQSAADEAGTLAEGAQEELTDLIKEVEELDQELQTIEEKLGELFSTTEAALDEMKDLVEQLKKLDSSTPVEDKTPFVDQLNEFLKPIGYKLVNQ